MDRRQAIRRIAAGTGATVAASAVVTSPAFAYDAPTVSPGPPTPLVHTVGFERVDVESNGFGTATCPASANATSVAGTFLGWNIRVVTNIDNTLFQLRRYNGGPILATFNTTATHNDYRGFRIRKRRPTSTTALSWKPNDAFEVDLRVRYTCTYSDGTTRSVDHTKTIRLTKGPGASSANDWIVVVL